jgi:hypothetical protein
VFCGSSLSVGIGNFAKRAMRAYGAGGVERLGRGHCAAVSSPTPHLPRHCELGGTFVQPTPQ